MHFYSHSRLNTFEHCPLQFKLKYLDLVPEPFETIEVFVGKRVHEVLEQLFRTLSPENPPSLSKMLQSYHDAWEQKWNQDVRIVRGDSPLSYLHYGEKCLKHFHDTFAPFNQSTTVHLEQKLEFPLGDGGLHGIQGYADRISLRPDGTYEIHDYKTGRRALTQRDVDSDRQLSLYEIGYRALQPVAEEIELIWHCLGVGITLRSQRTPIQRVQVLHTVQELILHIESQEDFPANKTRLCDWCAYRTICPAWNV